MRSKLLLAALAGALSSEAAAQALPVCPATPAAFAEVRERVLHPKPGHISVVAHRACFSAAPENSPAAVEACWRAGVEVVENDVRRTKDGHLVVLHDDTLTRMTDGWGYVGDKTLAELKALRLREREGGPAAFVTNVPVTTLEEYLEAARNRVLVNLELKPADGATWAELYRQSVELARRMGVLDHLLVKAPDTRGHSRVSARHVLDGLDLSGRPALMPVIWESERQLSARLDQLERVSPEGYEIPFQSLAYVEDLRGEPRLAGRPVMMVAVQPYWSGGLDDRMAMREPDRAWGRLVELGATMVMTDRPEALLTYLNAKGLRAPRKCAAPANRSRK